MRSVRMGMLLLPLMCLAVLACRSDDLLVDMVDLDRAYVAALYNAERGDNTAQTVMSVKEFKLRWLMFSSKYASALAEEPVWKEEFGRLEPLVMDADRHSNFGEIKESYRSLVEFGTTIMEFRRQNGIEYYLDNLIEYRGLMEQMVSAASDGGLSPADLVSIEKALPRATALWEKTTASDFDRKLFGFSSKKEESLRGLMEQEAEALGRLESSLKSMDRKAIAKATLALRPPYEEAYRLFGDFSGFDRL